MSELCEYGVYDDDDLDGPAWRCHNSASVFYVQTTILDSQGSTAYETHAICEDHRKIADSCRIGVRVSESEYGVYSTMDS